MENKPQYSYRVYKGQGGWWFAIYNARARRGVMPHVDGPFVLKRAAAARAKARTERYNAGPKAKKADNGQS